MLKLTKKQEAIIDCLKQGMSNKEIAEKRCISEVTVKMHIHALFLKFGVKSRLQLVLKANEMEK